MQNANLGTFEKFNASKCKAGIVVAQFNTDITSELLKTALAKLGEYQVPAENITVARVAGCVEIPVVLKAMVESKKYDFLIAIGAVVRGGTPHFEYVCKMVSEGVLRVMMDYGMPVGFGVLTLENIAQAPERYSVGAGAAEAALQAVRAIQEVI